VIAEACRLLDDPVAYRQMAQAVNPYGDGHAADYIVNALLEAENANENPTPSAAE
jgi:UDP-N-acetylglucosamine 2-epimerase